MPASLKQTNLLARRYNFRKPAKSMTTTRLFVTKKNTKKTVTAVHKRRKLVLPVNPLPTVQSILQLQQPPPACEASTRHEAFHVKIHVPFFAYGRDMDFVAEMNRYKKTYTGEPAVELQRQATFDLNASDSESDDEDRFVPLVPRVRRLPRFTIEDNDDDDDDCCYSPSC